MKKLIPLLLSVLLLSSCSGNTAVTVGDIKITQSEVEFYLDSIKSQMSDTELQTDEDWQTKEIEGKKAIEVAKKQALDNAVNNALYVETAKAAGITLNSEDEQEINGIIGEFMNIQGSEKGYKDFLKENKLDDKFIRLMCESSIYYRKIGELVWKEADITEENKKLYFEENKSDFERDVRKAKHILIATMDPETYQPKSQEEQDAASVLAKEIFAKVQNGEDFDKLMNQYSEDPGLGTSPDGYVFGSGEMVPEFEQTTDSVGFGEVAFCKSEFGYHIIKRLPISYEDAKSQVDSQLIGKLVDEKVKEWKAEYSIEVVENEKVINNIK